MIKNSLKIKVILLNMVLQVIYVRYIKRTKSAILYFHSNIQNAKITKLTTTVGYS